MERAELADAPEIATIEITEPLPESGVVDSTYKIKGSVKMFDAIGAPPWVYAEVRLKEWDKPEVAEEVSYERGFPMPITGEFTIEFKPEKEGDYEITVLATPAPLSLPVIGVFPVTGKSDVMKVAVGERPPAVFRFSDVTIDENDIALTDHDADSGLLLEKTTADYLDITPAFEWTGPSKKATVSIKAGYRDWLGAFSPKTGAYTRTITLPESPTTPYSGELESPIRIPLTACSGITDGAIEMVLKIAREPDYISRIWNVYATKAPPEALDFDLTRPSVSQTPVDPGTIIDITCPITSRCEKAVDARAKVIIYEGSALPGHGSKIKQYDSDVFHIEPNESTNVVVHHTAVKGTIDRRDVEVEVYVDTQLVKESEWDDVFYVGVPPEEVIDFNLTRPTVTPAEIAPGTPITITCPVTSACTKEQTATAQVKIYEGSFYAGHGTLITTKNSPAFSIAPGQAYNVIVQHTAIAGTIDRRDVEVEIYIGGKLVKESEWDDIYYVIIPPPPPVPPTSDIRNFDFQPVKGTYDVGDRVSYSAPYEYKGKAQGGWLTIYLGTGVYPYFSIKHTYPRTAVSFGEAMDWTLGQLSGNFLLPSTLVPGQTYNVRAKLETADGKQIIDTDWGVITIPEITPPPPPVPPAADIRNLDLVATKGTYDIGDRVPFTCNYEYKGKAQGGHLVLSLGTGVYPTFSTVVNYYPMPVSFDEAMDWTRRSFTGTFLLTEALNPGRTYNTRAKLETLDDRTKETDTDWEVVRIQEAAPPGEYTVFVLALPLAAGWVTKEPDKDSYAYGETVKLTAMSAPGYKFSYWQVDGEWAGYSSTLTLMVTTDLEVRAYYTKV
ncbi:MAG TPA: hypothetical protein VMW64_04470 [Dehalococcoidia bacterium]|nr:hypothetical protein [Dehalococcoidia bacterium]